jgi:hypothetical protein
MAGRPPQGRTVSRYDAAVAQLKELQAKHPGQIAIIAFGDEATVCPGGMPPAPNGWTMLYLALEKAREADTGAMKFVIISDGLPQHRDLAKREAEQFSVPIDVIYVGRDERGEEFMKDFALWHKPQCKAQIIGEMNMMCYTGLHTVVVHGGQWHGHRRRGHVAAHPR